MTMIATRDQRPRLAGPVPRSRLAAASAGAGMTARDAVRILRKRILLIIVCVPVLASVPCTWLNHIWPRNLSRYQLLVEIPIVLKKRPPLFKIRFLSPNTTIPVVLYCLCPEKCFYAIHVIHVRVCQYGPPDI